MSEDWLRVFFVINALIICGFALVTWSAFSVPIVAAMVTQIILVAQPRRSTSVEAAPPSTA